MRIGTVQDLFFSDAATSLFKLWSQLPRAENQTIPKRFELNLETLSKETRDNVFLMTRLDSKTLSASDIGQNITQFLGERLDGQDIAHKHGPRQMQYEMPYYDAIFSVPCAGVMVRKTINHLGTHADFTSCHLPLLDYQNRVTYLAGVAAISNMESPEKAGERIVFDGSEIVDRVFVDIGNGLPDGVTD